MLSVHINIERRKRDGEHLNSGKINKKNNNFFTRN